MAGVDYTARALKESFTIQRSGAEQMVSKNIVDGLFAIAKSIDAVAEAITRLDDLDRDAIVKGIMDVNKEGKAEDAMGLREFNPHGF